MLTFANTTQFDIFKAAGSYERFILWDNARVDITDAEVFQLFVDGGTLVDPAVAVASVGTSLISFYGARLNSGSNAGSGGDWDV